MTDAEVIRQEYLKAAAQISIIKFKAYEDAIRMARGHPERLAQIQQAMLADYERDTRHIVRAIGQLPPLPVIVDLP